MTHAPPFVALTFLVFPQLCPGQAPPREYTPAGGPHEVTATKLDWKDARRDRDVPVKVYAPKAGKGPFPVIVFSHGLGGTRDGYEYLGRHWASHGYVCVHLQHKGSDDAVWKGSKEPLAAMRKATLNPTNALNRPLDVRFALDTLTRLNRNDPALKGRLDLERVGMAGHSFGGWTTQAVIGEVFVTPAGKDVTMSDPRVKAAIIMSPSAPKGKADLDRSFGSVKVPCLHMTGTKDDGVAITDVKPAERHLPFAHMKKADRYLLVFEGGDHMVFSGRKGGEAKDARFRELIRMSSTAFWDAYLRGDAQARAWLEGEGFRRALASDGTFARKAAQQ
jgi:predicted dienelactone hydrolase